jgi:hypothetical protein
MDHKPVKISIPIIDVLFNDFKWRAHHHTPALDVDATNNMNENLLALGRLPGPLPPVDFSTNLTIVHNGILDEFFIYNWDDFNDNYKCFNYGELIIAREIEDNLAIDVGIIPALMDYIPTRDHYDNNGIRAKTSRILRSQMLEYDL